MPETTAGTIEEKKSGKSRQRKRRIPVKRSINLATVNQEKINWAITVPAIFLILVAAAIFSKFGVVDRYEAAAAARREVDAVRQRLNTAYAEIEAMGDLSDRYAHYTTSGMTADELTRADRVEVMDMLQRRVAGRMPADTWTISGNRIALTITGRTLQEINILVQELMTEDLVNYCTLNTVSGTVAGDAPAPEATELLPLGDDIVTANIVIILNSRSREVEAP